MNSSAFTEQFLVKHFRKLLPLLLAGLLFAGCGGGGSEALFRRRRGRRRPACDARGLRARAGRAEGEPRRSGPDRFRLPGRRSTRRSRRRSSTRSSSRPRSGSRPRSSGSRSRRRRSTRRSPRSSRRASAAARRPSRPASRSRASPTRRSGPTCRSSCSSRSSTSRSRRARRSRLPISPPTTPRTCRSTRRRRRGRSRRSSSARTSRRSRRRSTTQVKAGGDFAALAKKYSQDPGSKNKGGKFTANQGTRRARSSTRPCSTRRRRPESLLKPVNTAQYGWFVIKPLADITPAKTTPEKKAAAAIRKTLDRRQAAADRVRLDDEDLQELLLGQEDRLPERVQPTTDPCATLNSSNPTTT